MGKTLAIINSFVEFTLFAPLQRFLGFAHDIRPATIAHRLPDWLGVVVESGFACLVKLHVFLGLRCLELLVLGFARLVILVLRANILSNRNNKSKQISQGT